MQFIPTICCVLFSSRPVLQSIRTTTSTSFFILSINTLSAVISYDRMWYIFISSTYTVHFSYSNSIKDCIVFFFARLTRQHSCQCCFLFSIIFLAPLIFIWLTDCIIINKVCKVCVEMISSLSISFDKHRINCEK